MVTGKEFQLQSLEATRQLADGLADNVRPPMTVALIGSLGTGKTQLVRFFAQRLGIPAEEITSPTYVLLQRYVGQCLIYHFDFYRLNSAEEAWELGIDELYEQPVIICIEWADKFPECLPADHLRLELHQHANSTRTAFLSATGPRSLALLERCIA